MKYKYITIRKNYVMANKKPIYSISNNETNELFGTISFDKEFGEFTLFPISLSYYSKSCLRDIINFIETVVEDSTVSVMISIIDLYPASYKTTYKIQTRSYIKNQAVKNKWNKGIKRKSWKEAVAICEKWKEQMNKEGVQFWQQ